ncbi:vacuolar iron transporter homolog 5-like [Argentina anserina]|uniref:vacuolar iron transporter homolog 5-like n=1 Tax=Argentina anserina TaxID=57926 RepID=UPI0021767F4E|nr:vacuolar iron transporter homolog 5-like [Potentilla anserina]
MASGENCVEHELPVSTGEDYKTRSEQVQRAQWLRAAILGASDGLISTTSLMLGVGAAKDDRWSMILSGVAGAVAGACSMAVGEYVSVSTQRDIEKVSLGQSSSTLNSVLRERDGNGKVVKLNIPESSFTISIELTPSRRPSPSEKPTGDATEKTPTKINMFEIKDTDEEESLPSPSKAASASALAFLLGSLVPLLSAIFIPQNSLRMLVIVVVTSVALALFGAIGARMGGSPVRISAIRVLVGGWIAMAVTYGLLRPFDKDGSKGSTDKN